MRKIGSVVLCCIGVMAVSAGGALAGNGNSKANGNSTPSPKKVASMQCTAELHAMGVKAFKQLYGDAHKKHANKKQHAMRNCKRQHGNSGGNMVQNAAHECKAEMADPNFPATHGGMTFAEFYGTNHNDRNAFGKCVSGKVHEALAELRNDLQNAAQMCREERADPNFASTHDGKTFTEFYGTNKNKKNAFGKCVSQKAKAQPSA